MDGRSVAALIILGIGIGFLLRSGMRALGKVVIILIVLIVANAVAPEGLPNLAQRGVQWVYAKVAHSLSGVAKEAKKTTLD